ncbi:cytochrome P450 [Amanita rubescens]|nr:cytochrome P450 [Amanita rubescens]
MAMALYPSVQKRVRDEIDRVVGRHRLPTFDDRPSLPHVDAVLRETLRGGSLRPLLFPIWQSKMTYTKGSTFRKGDKQDETIYSNPDTFNPNRFFNPDGTLNDDKIEYAFGYGRRHVPFIAWCILAAHRSHRLCPGRHMARDVLWLMMASVLATFNILKEKDENGVDIDIDQNAFTSGLSSSPRPFKCAVVPRSPRAAKLIRTVATAAKESMNRG